MCLEGGGGGRTTARHPGFPNTDGAPPALGCPGWRVGRSSNAEPERRGERTLSKSMHLPEPFVRADVAN